MHTVGGFQGIENYYAMQKWGVGTIVVPAPHPDGQLVPKDMLQSIVLDPTLPLLDPANYTRIAKLFIWALKNVPGLKESNRVDVNNEALALIGYADDYSHCIVGVPPQELSGARVAGKRSEGVVNIETGEVYSFWPPEGYRDAGDIHSHNTMPAFFSGTDNADDASLPGLHLVFGNFRMDTGGIWHWDIASSVVANYTRYQKILMPDLSTRRMTAKDLIQNSFVGSAVIHPNVYEVLSIPSPRSYTKHTGPRIPMQFLTAGGFDGKQMQGESALVPARDWQTRREGFPTDYDWLHDFLEIEPEDREDPAQIKMPFDESSPDEPKAEEPPHWTLRYITAELDGMFDCIDRVLAIAPTEEVGREILAQSLNSLEYFQRVNPRKRKKAKS